MGWNWKLLMRKCVVERWSKLHVKSILNMQRHNGFLKWIVTMIALWAFLLQKALQGVTKVLHLPCYQLLKAKTSFPESTHFIDRKSTIYGELWMLESWWDKNMQIGVEHNKKANSMIENFIVGIELPDSFRNRLVIHEDLFPSQPFRDYRNSSPLPGVLKVKKRANF